MRIAEGVPGKGVKSANVRNTMDVKGAWWLGKTPIHLSGIDWLWVLSLSWAQTRGKWWANSEKFGCLLSKRQNWGWVDSEDII